MSSFFPVYLFFGFVLILGSAIATMSNNWLFVWVGLELNMMAFLPLLCASFFYQEVEASIKYFLAQAVGSGMLLFFLVGGMVGSSSSVLLIAMVMKMGVAPFHYWFPQVMSGSSWPACLMLSTWQKVGPLSLSVGVLESFSFVSGCVVVGFSALVGGVGGIGQSQLRPLFAYSSICHMSWVLAGGWSSCWGGLTYFFVYSVMMVGVVWFLWTNATMVVAQMSAMASISKMSGGVFFFLLLSLAGFPLMSGFFPKVMVLEILYCCGYVYISFFLIVGSSLSLYYYLSLAYLFLVGSSNKVNIYCWGGLMKMGVLWAVGAVGMFGWVSLLA